MATETFYVGDSGFVITIDTLAGTAGYVPTMAGATASLFVSLSPSRKNTRVQIPSGRFVPNNDNRTYAYTVAASDFPVAGTYNLQTVATFPDGSTRSSGFGQIVVAPLA